MGETLEEGLNALFGAGAVSQTRTTARDSASVSTGNQPAPAVPSAVNGDLLRQAQLHYDRAIAAQRAGNWADYGREIEQLGAAIRALRAGKE
jgi:uncharacterized membrane protein (UPF0182 family)